MQTNEIFGQVSNRMIEGLMTHSQLADYFGFIGLEGFQHCHLYHFFEENCNYKKIAQYYLKHYSKILIEKPFKNPNIIPQDWWQYTILIEKPFKNPNIIPQDWWQYTREQVNNEVRKNAIQIGFEKWVNWEKETKKFYESHYQNLVRENEIASAEELSKYIIDVDYELAEAEQIQIKLKGMDYSVLDIMLEQEDIKKRYEKKMKEIKIC